MYIVQTLMCRDWDTPPCLWLVTNAAHTVGGLKDLSLAQTPLWGLGRVIINEHASLQTWMVDLSPVPSQEEIRSLCEEVLLNDIEMEKIG